MKNSKTKTKMFNAKKKSYGRAWHVALCPHCNKEHGSASEKSILPDYVFCDCPQGQDKKEALPC